MKKSRLEDGFTVIELAVACAVAAFLMVTAVGTVTKVAPYWRVDESAGSITTTLRGARSQALANGEEVTIAFDVSGDRYAVLDRLAPCGVEVDTDGEGNPIRVATLPPEIHFTDPLDCATVTCSPPGSSGDTAVAFSSSGRLRSVTTPCYVYVGYPSNAYYRRVRVNVVGTMVVEKWNGESWE